MTHPTIAAPLLRLIGFGLRLTPIKTRLGGVSTLMRKVFKLDRHTDLVSTRLRSGATLRVRLSDYNGRMLYFFGTVDPKVVCTCKSLLREGDAFLDIGANHGAVGLQCFGRVGGGGSVHFVEPQPELCGVIGDAIKSVGASNASVHQIGLWDEDGEFTLQLEGGHTGAASLADTPEHGDGKGITVKTRKIDSFLDDTVGSGSFGAKIDVEGAEVKILPAILRHDGFRFAVFECNRDSVRDIVHNAAEERDLQLFGIEKNLWTVRLRPLSKDDDLTQFHDIVVLAGGQFKQTSAPVHPDRL